MDKRYWFAIMASWIAIIGIQGLPPALNSQSVLPLDSVSLNSKVSLQPEEEHASRNSRVYVDLVNSGKEAISFCEILKPTRIHGIEIYPLMLAVDAARKGPTLDSHTEVTLNVNSEDGFPTDWKTIVPNEARKAKRSTLRPGERERAYVSFPEDGIYRLRVFYLTDDKHNTVECPPIRFTNLNVASVILQVDSRPSF